MTWLAAGLATAVFILILEASGIVGAARRTVAQANDGLSVLRDPAASDDAKERASQRAAISLLVGGLGLAVRGALALGGSALLLLAGSLAGLYQMDDVTAVLLSWPFWIAGGLAGVAWMWLRR